jgi:aminopeptidase-like protein
MKEKINEIYEKINGEYSGKRAKDIAIQISKFHRIQVSPWFNEAILYCKNLLKNYGIKSFIHKFPSDGRKKYFTMNSFKKWNCKRGILYIKEPINKKIADFEEMKLRVIPRSGKVKGIFDVVYYDGGKQDLKNKIILTSNQEFIKEEFLKENKIKGVIFFGMNEIEGVRKKEDLMDALQYVSFWPVNENKFFGFIISPREGEELKKILIKNKKLKVYAEIDSEFKDGEIEVLEIFFKGKLEEEVWGIAHLCHPSPFINDNASGASSILELAITFKKLFENKILEKPLRGIRFLLLPEMTGTYAYLKYRENELNKIKGAINLDMVGEDQEKCKSTFCLIKEPLLIRSYISYLSEIIFEYIEDNLRKKVTEYSGGSDHYILIDPTIGIPCVMLGQWPDKFYHTSFDNEDKISEESLNFSGSFAGTLLYYIASLKDEDVEKIAEKMNFLFNKKIYEMKIKEENPLKEKLYYLSYRNALNSLKIFKKDFEPQKFLKEIKVYKIDFEKKGKILKRNFKAPLYFKALLKKMDNKEKEWFQKNLKEKKHLRGILELFLYYVNGKRSFNEICEIIKIETGEDESLFLKKFYKILEKYKFLI